MCQLYLLNDRARALCCRSRCLRRALWQAHGPPSQLATTYGVADASGGTGLLGDEVVADHLLGELLSLLRAGGEDDGVSRGGVGEGVTSRSLTCQPSELHPSIR